MTAKPPARVATGPHAAVSSARSATARSASSSARFGWRCWRVVLLIALFPVYFMDVTAFHPPTLSYGADADALHDATDASRLPRSCAPVPLHALDAQHLARLGLQHDPLRLLRDLRRLQPLAAALSGAALVFSNAVFLVYLFPSTLLFIPIFIVCKDLHLLDQLARPDRGLSHLLDPLQRLAAEGVLPEHPARAGGRRAGRWRDALAEHDARSSCRSRRRASRSASIYSFTLAWNEYLYAFTLLSDSEKFTLAPGLTKLIFGDVFLWGMIMAGAS